MAGRSPAGPLMREHRVIEQMIGVLRAEMDAIDRTGVADSAALTLATEFIRWYADRCHHGKEEDILFLRLRSKDLDAETAALMDELVQDHVFGRELTRRVVTANRAYAAGDSEAVGEIRAALGTLVDFYPKHIEKEDRHFFRPAVEALTLEERDQMLADFDEFDRALVHERYLAIVTEASSLVGGGA